MMIFILSLCRALRAGESLADPAIWKQRQLRLNALLPIIYYWLTLYRSIYRPTMLMLSRPVSA